MLLHTENNSPLHALEAQKDKQREQMKAWVEHQTGNAMYLDDPLTSPANALARIGKSMKSEDMEKKLKKLNHSLHFEYNSFNSSKKMIYLVDRRGKTPLFPYESGIMPERSIMNVKEEYVPVKDLFDNPKFVMDRKDLGPQKLVPGKGFVAAEGTKNPYMERVLIPWSEKIRGWRTVLIKLVISGAITPHQAETSFGAADNREWQNSLGKAKHSLPW